MRAAVFPGQGSQRTGMGERLFHLSARVRSFYDDASDVLGLDVAGLCFRAPPAVLTETRNAQIAITVSNLAAYELLLEVDEPPDLVAGHSVGELAAVAAAGALDVDELLRTVARRAELMGSVTTRGVMQAVTGCPAAEVERACAEVEGLGPLVVAVYNADHQVVISGTEAAVDEAASRLRRPGVRSTRVAVSHAFHSPLMASVADDWRACLDQLVFRDPQMPIVTNVTGRLLDKGEAVRQALADHLTSPVRWVDCVATMVRHGVETAIETGDSRLLAQFSRHATPPLRTVLLRDVIQVSRLGGRNEGVRHDAV